MRTRLKGGLHFLFVQGTDLAGNTGRPMRYDWIVGEYNNTNKLVLSSSLPWTSSSNIYNNLALLCLGVLHIACIVPVAPRGELTPTVLTSLSFGALS